MRNDARCLLAEGTLSDRIFWPCDPRNHDKDHADCSYFNDYSGETCACPNHTKEDIAERLKSLRAFGIVLPKELEE